MAAARRLIQGVAGSRIDDDVKQAAAAMGLHVVADEQQNDGIAAWPENELTIQVFIAMGTQWNVGMSGASGLRYEALPAVMRYCGVPPAERGAVFSGLRVMESAALEAIHGR